MQSLVVYVAEILFPVLMFPSGADRSQRDRALLDNGEEDEDNGPSGSGSSRYSSQPPFAAERYQQSAQRDQHATETPSSDFNGSQQHFNQRPNGVRQQDGSPQSPDNNGRLEDDSKAAQRPLDSSATQRIRPPGSRQSAAEGVNTSGASNEAASSSQVHSVVIVVYVSSVVQARKHTSLARSIKLMAMLESLCVEHS